MTNTQRHFIKFLRNNNMLIPILILMAENNVSWKNLNPISPLLWFQTITRITWSNLTGIYAKLDDKWDHFVCEYEDESDLPLIPAPTPSKPRRPKEHQKFIDFLKENDALIPFCVNSANGFDPFSRGRSTPVHLSLTKALSQKFDPSNVDGFSRSARLIDETFDWSETPEGRIYWNSLKRKCNYFS